jgi:hypothetical protein
VRASTVATPGRASDSGTCSQPGGQLSEIVLSQCLILRHRKRLPKPEPYYQALRWPCLSGTFQTLSVRGIPINHVGESPTTPRPFVSTPLPSDCPVRRRAVVARFHQRVGQGWVTIPRPGHSWSRDAAHCPRLSTPSRPRPARFGMQPLNGPDCARWTGFAEMPAVDSVRLAERCFGRADEWH